MALRNLISPVPQVGESITNSSDTEKIIKRGWANTFPNNGGSQNLGYNVYYGGQTDWHFRIADSSIITPREGSHSFYARALMSQPLWGNSGGIYGDRITYITGSKFTFNDKEEVWFGWSVFFRNIGGDMPSTVSFHTVADSHITNAIGSACWDMWFRRGGTIKIDYRTEGSASGINAYSASGPGGWFFDEWMDFGVNVRRDYNGGTGRLRVWMRRPALESSYRQLVNLNNINLGYGPPDTGNNLQIDSYIRNNVPAGSNYLWSREYYLSPIRIGDANSSLAEVSPGQDQTSTTVATPAITPNGGTFTTAQTITLTCATAGATISYTTNGTTPSPTNGTQVISGATFQLAASALVQTMAFKSGSFDSATASANFTITTGQETGIVRINSGGGAFTDSSANNWQADQYFNGGVTRNRPNPISNTPAPDQVLYQTSRAWTGGTSGAYNVPITAGEYRARLHFADTASETSFSGARVFDASLEGELVADNQDIYALVGSNAPIVRQRAVMIADGVADLSFVPSADNAFVCGMEFFPIGTGAGTGNALIEPAQAAANTTAGTQDIISAALGSEIPKAAILWWTHATANGTAVADARMGIGFTDGVSQFAMAIAGQDGLTIGTSCRTRAMTDRAICLIAAGGSGGVSAEAGFSAFIAGGIRINWSTPPAAGWRLNALLFAGNDVQAHVATIAFSTSGTAVDITSAGFQPTDGFVLCPGQAANDTSLGGAKMSIGAFSNRASLIQRSLWLLHQNSQYPSRSYAVLSTASVGGEIYPTTAASAEARYALTVGEFDAQGCSITATAGGGANGAVDSGDQASMLLLRISNVLTRVHDFTAPVSTGAAAVTGLGFEPASIFEVIGSMLSTDVFIADTTASGSGLSAYSANAAFASSVEWDDAVSTTNGNSITDAKATHLLNQGGTALQVATLTSLDSDGWTKNYTVASAAVKGFVWAIQSAATQQVVAPVIDPDGGVFAVTSVTVTLTTTTPGASMRYTTDGSTPSDTVGTVYTGPFSHNISANPLKALAYKAGLSNSAVSQAQFTFVATVETPVISPQTGTYGGPRVVEISTPTPGAEIRYTTDGSTPSGSSALYAGSFVLSSTATIKAIAILAGDTNSAVASSTITITSTIETPVIDPPTGTYQGPLDISMTCGAAGVSIYYTTDGTTPSETSTPFISTFPLNFDTTIKAIAILAGFSDSAVATADLEFRLHRVRRRRLMYRG